MAIFFMYFYYSTETFVIELRRVEAAFFFHFFNLPLYSAYMDISQLFLEL